MQPGLPGRLRGRGGQRREAATASAFFPMHFGVGAADVICIEGQGIDELAAPGPLKAEMADNWRENRGGGLEGSFESDNIILRRRVGEEFRYRGHDRESGV